MKPPTRKFAEQLSELVHSELLNHVGKLGIDSTAENRRKVDLAIRAFNVLLDEEAGIKSARDLSATEIAEVEGFEDLFRGGAMVVCTWVAGRVALKEGDVESAVKSFSLALMMFGYNLGRTGSNQFEEIIRRAKLAAQKRHEKTYEERENVRQYWLANIDRTLNNTKAADILFKEFSLDHRTLAGYVAAFKRELLGKI